MVPSLLVAGLVTLGLAGVLIVRAWRAAELRHPGAELSAWSILLLASGGGFFPPVLGLVAAGVAARLHANPRATRWTALRRTLRTVATPALAVTVACLVFLVPVLPAPRSPITATRAATTPSCWAVRRTWGTG